MCWGCNPLCGGCRPPRQKAVKCPVCGWYNVLEVQDRGEPCEVGCERCGFDLTGHATSHTCLCARFAVLCANPCGLAHKVDSKGNLGRCQNRVEPDEWHPLEIV